MTTDWKIKYEPKTIDEMILSDEKKYKLKKILTDIPNTILYGNAGTGKSCFMKILGQVSGINQPLRINASLENGIEVIRHNVGSYSKAASFDLESKKIVYFEEADKLTGEAQNALKDLIELVQKQTSFFFLCNDLKNIIDPIQSRCSYRLNLEDPPRENIFSHLKNILKLEQVRVKKDTDIYYVIDNYYPDIRKIIGSIQSQVRDGVLIIDSDLKLSGKKKAKFKTAEQRRQADRSRAKKWHEKQKASGKRQISCTISNEAFEILRRMGSMNGKSYGQIIEELLLN